MLVFLVIDHSYFYPFSEYLLTKFSDTPEITILLLQSFSSYNKYFILEIDQLDISNTVGFIDCAFNFNVYLITHEK